MTYLTGPAISYPLAPDAKISVDPTSRPVWEVQSPPGSVDLFVPTLTYRKPHTLMALCLLLGGVVGFCVGGRRKGRNCHG